MAKGSPWEVGGRRLGREDGGGHEERLHDAGYVGKYVHYPPRAARRAYEKLTRVLNAPDCRTAARVVCWRLMRRGRKVGEGTELLVLQL